MATTWDLNDVPAVSANELATLMQSLIDNGRGLVFLRGLEDEDLDTVQAELHCHFHGEPQRALAIFVRFRHLVEVFSARRLKDLLMNQGHGLLAPALAIAAELRLNAHRGFNPQWFVLALHDALTSNVVALDAHRPATVASPEHALAA